MMVAPWANTTGLMAPEAEIVATASLTLASKPLPFSPPKIRTNRAPSTQAAGGRAYPTPASSPPCPSNTPALISRTPGSTPGVIPNSVASGAAVSWVRSMFDT